MGFVFAAQDATVASYLKRDNETLDAISCFCKRHQSEEEKSRGEI